MEGVGRFYSTPNESLRLTLYSTTLPSFTIVFLRHYVYSANVLDRLGRPPNSLIDGIFESSTRRSYELNDLSNRHFVSLVLFAG